MDAKTWNVIDCIADYDDTIFEMLYMVNRLEEDSQCDEDTMSMAEGLLISVIIDKAAPLIPEDPERQQEVVAQADGLARVVDSLGEPLPLLYNVAIGYALALSQGRNGWRPWERLRDIILEEDNEHQGV